MENQNLFKIYDFYDGECFITFTILGFTHDNKIVTVAIENRGKITVKDFDIISDYDDEYFEYSCNYTKIYIKDFID